MSRHTEQRPHGSTSFEEVEERKQLVLDRVRGRREAIAFVKRCLETEHPATYANTTINADFGTIEMAPQQEHSESVLVDSGERDTDWNDERVKRYACRYEDIYRRAVCFSMEDDSVYQQSLGDLLNDTDSNEEKESHSVEKKLVQFTIDNREIPHGAPERLCGQAMATGVKQPTFECNRNGEHFKRSERDPSSLGYSNVKTVMTLPVVKEIQEDNPEHVSPAKHSPIIMATPPLSSSGSDPSTPFIQTPTMEHFPSVDVVFGDDSASGSPSAEAAGRRSSDRFSESCLSDEKHFGVIEQLRLINNASRRRYAIHWDFEEDEHEVSPPLPAGPYPALSAGPPPIPAPKEPLPPLPTTTRVQVRSSASAVPSTKHYIPPVPTSRSARSHTIAAIPLPPSGPFPPLSFDFPPRRPSANAPPPLAQAQNPSKRPAHHSVPAVMPKGTSSYSYF
ncbi:hypothetical protein D9613_010524 [Agrocybe pediades]|uniref:Uncharacterized protein n=1 Tax=Agrocybe pediades TaxID=84607 RepID=A0A8H4VI10_9AGAR|nr:hypothetical protein D9613_010524 [Agrocybe pediades]